VSCPHCGASVAAGDSFCEACGNELVAGIASPPPVDPVTDSTHGADTAELPRTHLLVPDGDREAPGWGVDTSLPCAACGAEVADDGFCTVCGHKARTRREHWTETLGDRVGAVCDKGIVHARNEDGMALGLGPTDATATATVVAVVVVCDGVTTAPDSDRASLVASVAARDVLVANPPVAGSLAARVSQWEPVMVSACRAANAEAVAVARTLGDPPEPPSCTFVAAVVDGDLVATAWCGDSRAYWLPDAVPGEQLTTDHSLGTEMIRDGMTREQAEASPDCHTITRWLGADSVDPTPEYRTVQVVQPGWLLVCSDGMWNYASDPVRLAELIDEARRGGAVTPTAIAESLAAHANACGGHDNVTVALVRCGAPLP
jgi:serine/threonine protein phosphatase PrpC